jgi:hypothetical protein
MKGLELHGIRCAKLLLFKYNFILINHQSRDRGTGRRAASRTGEEESWDSRAGTGT